MPFHIGINPRSAHIEEATKFIRFMTSVEAGKQFFALIPYPPVRKELYEGFLPDTDFWKITRYELSNTAVPRPKTRFPRVRGHPQDDVPRHPGRSADS